MAKSVAETEKPETLASYQGLLNHGNANKIRNKYLSDSLPDFNAFHAEPEEALDNY
jgi:hypothetical protein